MNRILRPQHLHSPASRVPRPLATLRKVGGLALAGVTLAAVAAGCGSSQKAAASLSSTPSPARPSVSVLWPDFALPIDGGWLHYGWALQGTRLALEMPEGSEPTLIYEGPALDYTEQDIVVRRIVCQPSSEASKYFILIGATKLDLTTFSDEDNTIAISGLEGTLALSVDRIFFLAKAPTQGQDWSLTVGGNVVISGKTDFPSWNGPDVCVAEDPTKK
jgi:hypothetical protein